VARVSFSLADLPRRRLRRRFDFKNARRLPLAIPIKIVARNRSSPARSDCPLPLPSSLPLLQRGGSILFEVEESILANRGGRFLPPREPDFPERPTFPNANPSAIPARSALRGTSFARRLEGCAIGIMRVRTLRKFSIEFAFYAAYFLSTRREFASFCRFRLCRVAAGRFP